MQVTDTGLMCVGGLGVLERLVARACPGISDKGLVKLGEGYELANGMFALQPYTFSMLYTEL